MLGAVALDHRRQLQALAHFARERQADQAARVAGHEVDGFGRDVVGGDDDVALVLAVFLVHQDHHAAGGEVGHDVLDRGDRGWGARGAGGADRRDGGVHSAVSLEYVEDGGTSTPAWSMRST